LFPHLVKKSASSMGRFFMACRAGMSPLSFIEDGSLEQGFRILRKSPSSLLRATPQHVYSILSLTQNKRIAPSLTTVVNAFILPSYGL
jgi:hypothetical protein